MYHVYSFESMTALQFQIAMSHILALVDPFDRCFVHPCIVCVFGSCPLVFGLGVKFQTGWQFELRTIRIREAQIDFDPAISRLD